MKPLSFSFRLLLLLFLLGLRHLSYSSVNDSFSLQSDHFFMHEGETQTFNFISNDYVEDIGAVTITILDSARSNINYLGNGLFSIEVPVYDTIQYTDTIYRTFRYKVTSNNDPLIQQTASVLVRIRLDKRNHKSVVRGLLLNEDINVYQIPLPEGFAIMSTRSAITNKPDNTGRTRVGEYSMNIVLGGNTLPFFSYHPFFRSGIDTFEIVSADTVLNETDTTLLVIIVIPISNENGITTRWFYKNSGYEMDTSTFNTASSDSIVSFCNGQTAGSSIYGSYNIASGHFYYRPSLLQAGLDSVCVRSVSGTQNKYYFVTVINDIITIQGALYVDLNSNCLYDSVADARASLNGLGIYASNSRNENLYGSIDGEGNYAITVPDTGVYTIKINNNPFGALVDPCASVVHLPSDYFDSTYWFDVGLHARYTSCGFPIVNISASSNFRRCRSNTFYVNYANMGLQTLQDAYVDVTLEEMVIQTATLPYDSLGNGKYRFHLGDVLFGQTGDFNITAHVLCDETILGQTLCSEAHIYPDAVCPTPAYTGSLINASVRCLGDSVRFQLHNSGGDMQNSRKYIVIQDDVMRISRNYQLNNDATLTETLKADSGSTYRIIAEREINFPALLGDLYTTAAIENCAPVPVNFSTGFITQFPNYDGEPFRSVSCNEIIGSYDPNDKVAFPLGYAAQHYIEANMSIDYQINFQNTGNDTAFRVMVIDTIAAVLDINTIEMGAASHAYRFRRQDTNVVAFVFDDIYLVDSNRNEALSHGFIKFKIKQKQDNPDGTKIFNSASIYFDYNAPVITNRTYHTIGRDFLRVNLVSGTRNPDYHVKKVSVYPNPFRDRTQIMVEGDMLKNPVLQLMDMEGRIVKAIPSVLQNIFEVYREDLSEGMYLFRIIQGDLTVAGGKLIIQ